MKPVTLVTKRLYFGLDAPRLRDSTERVLSRVHGIPPDRAKMRLNALVDVFRVSATASPAMVDEIVGKGLLRTPLWQLLSSLDCGQMNAWSGKTIFNELLIPLPAVSRGVRVAAIAAAVPRGPAGARKNCSAPRCRLRNLAGASAPTLRD